MEDFEKIYQTAKAMVLKNGGSEEKAHQAGIREVVFASRKASAAIIEDHQSEYEVSGSTRTALALSIASSEVLAGAPMTESELSDFIGYTALAADPEYKADNLLLRIRRGLHR